ncbi:MAG: class II fructose-bisphosphate aldolase, partial [Deltaproteobacteria bacterium]|nr:class II fructose-bisphosphate aldolase [Deltaproteobacteria bacterium]
PMGFTVPAINIRGITFDTARAVFRAAEANKAGAFIFEIAKSEIGYTDQRPAEYTAAILAAAIKEGHSGGVFIQGDHFQVNAAKYNEDKNAEIRALKSLIKEAIEAGFYNIDIDASTIVDLSKDSVKEQQRPNFETTAALTVFIRGIEPEGITVSIGGEIGEVGTENSTEEELRAFMDGYLDILGGNFTPISKVSVQTGTSHGGVVLPDGTIASVNVDFDIIENLTKVSREAYGLSGVVQHGASTLPDDAFHLFAERGASEVHLATGFQNMTYDSDSFPKELLDNIYAHLKSAHKDEWKEGLTEEQFIYKTRKKGFGPFKEEMWNMSEDVKATIGKELEAKFDFLFKKLNATDN